STEVKQYMPDILIATALILLAISNSYTNKSAVKSTLLLALTGSLAIWLSMPSVFILIGVCCYSIVTAGQNKQYRQIWLTVFVAVIWLIQFGFYYWYLLLPQANSSYLQQYHYPYFIIALP